MKKHVVIVKIKLSSASTLSKAPQRLHILWDLEIVIYIWIISESLTYLCRFWRRVKKLWVKNKSTKSTLKIFLFLFFFWTSELIFLKIKIIFSTKQEEKWKFCFPYPSQPASVILQFLLHISFIPLFFPAVCRQYARESMILCPHGQWFIIHCLWNKCEDVLCLVKHNLEQKKKSHALDRSEPPVGTKVCHQALYRLY